MNTKQRWRFILFTLPICAIVLSIGISQIGNQSSTRNVNFRVGNVWSTKSSYPNYAEQEKLNISNFDY